MFTVSAEKLHHRPPTRFQIRNRLGVMQIQGWVECKCIELVAADRCTRKWLRFDQTIRNLTSGDLGIPLVVNQLERPRLEKTSCISWTCLRECGRRGNAIQCVERLLMIGLMLMMLMSYSGEYNFNSLGSWSYSKEWVWNLRTKSILHYFT